MFAELIKDLFLFFVILNFDILQKYWDELNLQSLIILFSYVKRFFL